MNCQGAKSKINKLTGCISLLALVCLTLMLTYCKEKPFASQSLRFVLPITINPSASAANRGDTIWIEASFSDSLLELNSNKKIKLANFDFGQTSIGIRRLVDKQKGLSDQASAVINFDLIDKDGQITFPGETFVDFKFRYDMLKCEYLLRVGIAPRSVGIFCINFLGPTELFYENVLDLGIASNGAKIIPRYDYIVFPINNGINNIELFRENCLDQSKGPESDFWQNYRFTTFTFSVQ